MKNGSMLPLRSHICHIKIGRDGYDVEIKIGDSADDAWVQAQRIVIRHSLRVASLECVLHYSNHWMRDV
jgi:hypothetical protein